MNAVYSKEELNSTHQVSEQSGAVSEHRGFTKIPNAILRNPELSHGAVRLYALLVSYAWQDDTCYPGQELLLGHMGRTHRTTVYRQAKELEKQGLVSIERKHGNGKTSNVYTLVEPVQGDDAEAQHRGVGKSESRNCETQYQEKRCCKNARLRCCKNAPRRRCS